MKTKRQARILELIKEHDIETQSDLLEMLKERRRNGVDNKGESDE